MIPADPPADEAQRLKALARYEILDTEFEETFDQLTHLASCICEAPISLVSLIDENRQWFKSRVGLEATETPRELAFCAHAIHDDALFVVPDATADQRFSDNPLVIKDPSIRFYAGAPLITHDGYRLGTLCVIDQQPRDLTPFQHDALKTLARQVVDQLELRRSLRELEIRNQEIADLVASKDKLFAMISHDLRNPVAGIVGLADVMTGQLEEDDLEGVRDSMPYLTGACESAMGLLNNLLDYSRFETGNLRFNPDLTNLSDIVEDEISHVETSARNKGITIAKDMPEAAITRADAAMIASALRNLLSNAIKFTPNGQSVAVSITDNGDDWLIQVADEGIGMAPSQPEDASKPDQRRGTAGESGSGLGLSLVRRFLAHHDAELVITSAPDQGTKAQFQLGKA